MTLFNKLLIANRGEIACRIIRTAKRLGIKTVAVFSEVDCNALHAKIADEAYLIGSGASQDSYLNINKIINVAKQSGANAIHPGYGFLSENSEFAKTCERENIIFVGPSSTAIQLMANKNVAKEKMREHGVPILPGYYDQEQSAKTLLKQAKKIGFPVVLKAVAGGGGKGLRLVHDEKEFEHAYDAVKREAKAFFNDEKILLEKYLSKARHVEAQILADHFGNVRMLLTRDCSIQRRHQKIIEEAPAPNISDKMLQEMMTASVVAAKVIQYTNAGTIEFLVEGDAFYFMEMNTRLQVEHPVTEMITDLDLVEWQLRIAADEKLFLDEISFKGHAIEIRLNAEDPDNDFLPSSGKLHYFHFPTIDQHVRIDSGYQQGDMVNIYYDSLLAKLIAWDENRLLAIKRLQRLLQETTIFGIKTNLPLLKKILSNKNFIASKINTHFLQQEQLAVQEGTPNEIYILATLFLMLFTNHATKNIQTQDVKSPWLHHDGWQLYFPPTLRFNFSTNHIVEISKQNNGFIATIANMKFDCHLLNDFRLDENVSQLECIIGHQHWKAKIFKNHSKLEVITDGQHYYLAIEEENAQNFNLEGEEQLLAPMPGTIVALLVDEGQQVTKGDKLVVIEAMKMEHTLFAPRDGVIKQCYYKIGDLIKEGSELIEFET